MEKEESESYIVFEVAGTVYGIAGRQVQQLEMVENITPVPNAPSYVEGVMFSRGQVVTVINLRTSFGLEKRAFDIRTRIIVIRNNDRIAGLIVDSAKEYIRIPVENVHPAPGFLKDQSGSYLEGIAKTGERVILILNVPELLKPVENKQLTN